MPSATLLFESEVNELVERVRRGVLVVESRGGSGSATAWGPQLAVTNHHVVPGERARVTRYDGRAFEATVISRDAEHDLVLLEVPGGDFEALKPSTTLARTGQYAFAIGNPLGERGAFTAGIVLRAPGAKSNVIQADLRLAPGNSGGPMFDAEGRVLGINSMIAGGQAVAIAAPIVEAFVAEALGPVEAPGMLGIELVPIELPAGIAASLPAGARAGLLVAEVGPHTPAEQAGLLPGDVVIGIDGDFGPECVARALGRMRAGRRVHLDLVRAGQPARLEATPIART